MKFKWELRVAFIAGHRDLPKEHKRAVGRFTDLDDANYACRLLNEDLNPMVGFKVTKRKVKERN